MRPEWGRSSASTVRRWLVVGTAMVSTLLIGALFGLFVLYPHFGEQAIRDRVLPKLEARIGHAIEVGSIEVGLGEAVLRDVVVRDSSGAVLARVPSVVLRFGFGASLFGRIELDEVRLREPAVVTIIEKDGSTPWDQLIAWVRRKGDGEGGTRRLTPKLAVIEDGSFELRDRGRGLSASGTGLTVRAASGDVVASVRKLELQTELGPRAVFENATLRGRPRELSDTATLEIKGGELILSSGIRLTGVEGTVAPGTQDGHLWIDLSGSWGGSSGRLWQAKGNFDPRTRVGNLRVAADKFTLDRISDVLGDSPLRNIAKTSVGAELTIHSNGREVSASGSVEIVGLSLFDPKLASETLEDIELSGEVVATYDMVTRELALTKAQIISGGVEYTLQGHFRRGIDAPLDEFHARLVVPPVACQKVLDSLPRALVPQLQGFELDGTFSTDVEVRVLRESLEETMLTGSVGIRQCKVVRAAPNMSAGRIKEEFKHRAVVGFASDGAPKYKTISIGPSSSSYIPLSRVSPHLVNSLLTTEDSSFFKHHGFIVSEFRTALIKNLEAGYFRYGASSITMQLAKNVYLDRDKTVSRKLQELFMTWYLETQVKKERLMEVYVNAIEYGPGLYGIGPASRRYFGKSAELLTPTESAFFSSILPAPRRRFKQFCRDKISSWTERKIERVLELMLKRNRITELEYEEAMATPLSFSVEKSGCGRY